MDQTEPFEESVPNSLKPAGLLEALRYRLDAIPAEIDSVGVVSPALPAAKATIGHASTNIKNT